MLKISQGASDQIKAIMAEKNLTSAVRVFLQQGCGGSQLALGLDEERPNDLKAEFDGVTYVVDKDLSGQMGALSLDFVEDAAQQGFSLSSENPLPAGCSCDSGCSCG